MALIDILQPDVVRVPLHGTEKSGVIRELLGLLRAAGRLTDVDGAEAALLAREAQGSTGLEHGVAIPHAKTSAVAELSAAVGIAPEGIEFAALDGRPSFLFFLILAPPGQSGPHVEALAEIARLTKQEAVVATLLAARSPEEVVAVLEAP